MNELNPLAAAQGEAQSKWTRLLAGVLIACLWGVRWVRIPLSPPF